MVLTQYSRYLFDSIIATLLANGTHLYTREECLSSQTLHNRRVRSNNHIVLIHTPRVVALSFQNTYNAERDTLETNRLAYTVKVLVTEQLLDHRLAHDAHLCTLLYILVRKTFTVLDLPQLDVHILRTLAIHARSCILRAIDNLSRGSNFRTHVSNQMSLLLNAQVIVHLQRLHCARILSHTATHIAARTYCQQVRTHLAQFTTHTLLRTLAYSHHDNYRSNTYDNTQSAQQRAALIAHNCRNGNPQ